MNYNVPDRGMNRLTDVEVPEPIRKRVPIESPDTRQGYYNIYAEHIIKYICF